MSKKKQSKKKVAPQKPNPRFSAQTQPWQRNRDLLEDIDVKYEEWIATIAFYAALHMVDYGCLMKKNERKQNHTARLEFVDEIDDLQAISAHFRDLYTLSRWARYQYGERWKEPQETIETCVKHLRVIEDHVATVTNSAFKLPPIKIGDDVFK